MASLPTGSVLTTPSGFKALSSSTSVPSPPWCSDSRFSFWVRRHGFSLLPNCSQTNAGPRIQLFMNGVTAVTRRLPFSAEHQSPVIINRHSVSHLGAVTQTSSFGLGNMVFRSRTGISESKHFACSGGQCLKLGLTVGSTRTPPALSFALSQLLAISASLSVSVQARPVSLIR